MRRSEGRFLITHAGSLPRPPALTKMLAARNRGNDVDPIEFAAAVDLAVTEVVARQVEVGIDVVNDGEQGRESFFTHVRHRMSGFSPADGDEVAPRTWRDIADFPGFAAVRRTQQSGEDQVTLTRPPVASGPIRYLDTTAVDTDCALLARAADGLDVAEMFLTSPSPGIVAAGMANRYYPDLGTYLDAVADALAVEYRRIVEAGLVLQIDAPDLAMERHCLFADRETGEFLAFVDQVIDAINRATAPLPADRIRLHVCWGNYGGPHVHDIALAEVLPHLYRARVGGVLLSLANPRHGHEHRELARQPLPAGWVVAAGAIDTTTNYVEHPEVVAERIERVVEAVGDPTRVLACSDCGFDTAAGFGLVAPDVAWEKLRSLRAGADLAARRLF